MAEHTTRVEPALALAEARESLERQIDQAVTAYEKDHAGTLNLTVDLVAEQTDIPEGRPSLQELANTITSLVDGFQQRGIVQETGVYVYRVTVIDSDGDGKAAVNVKYEYRDDTGIG